MRTINISITQMYPVPGRCIDNLEQMKGAIENGLKNGAELFCFPECSLTGYSTEQANRIAIPENDPSVRKLCETAVRKNVIISFGFVELSGDNLFIAHTIAGPAGAVKYRKTHLGIKEGKVFTPGCEFPVYREQDLCIGVCLCTESHIPEIAGICRGKGAHLLLVPYASGMSGEKCKENLRIHLPARASDNGMFVAACNGLYRNEKTHGGGIAVFDPKGKEIASYFGEMETSVICSIGGRLPRDTEEDMHNISYFDRRRPELYQDIYF